MPHALRHSGIGECASDSLEITVVTPSGDTLCVLKASKSCTVLEFKTEVIRHCESEDSMTPNTVLLLAQDAELTCQSILGDVLQSPAIITLVRRRVLRQSASNIAGAHTNNPSYFCRENEGAEDEALVLKRVCWFDIGTKFECVPAGDYEILIEAAGPVRFKLEVVPTGENWDASADLASEFKEVLVGRLHLEESAANVVVGLKNHNLGWGGGLKIRSIILR